MISTEPFYSHLFLPASVIHFFVLFVVVCLFCFRFVRARSVLGSLLVVFTYVLSSVYDFKSLYGNANPAAYTCLAA